MDSLNMRIEYYISTFSNLDPVMVKTIVKKYNNKNEDKLIEKLLELSNVSIHQPCIDEQLSKNILDDELKFTPTGSTIPKSDTVKKKKGGRRWFTRTTNKPLFQKFD